MKCYQILRNNEVLSIKEINGIVFEREHYKILRDKVLERLDKFSNIDKKQKEILKKSFITLFDNEAVMAESLRTFSLFSVFLSRTEAYYRVSGKENIIVKEDVEEEPSSQLSGFIGEGDSYERFIYVPELIIEIDEEDEPYFDTGDEVVHVNFDSLLMAFLEAGLDAKEEADKLKKPKKEEKAVKNKVKEYKTFQDFTNNLNKFVNEIKPIYNDLDSIVFQIGESLPENGIIKLSDNNIMSQIISLSNKNVFFVFNGIPYKINKYKPNEYIRFKKEEEEYNPVNDFISDGAKEEILNIDNIDHDYFNNISTELANDFRNYSKEIQFFLMNDDIEVFETDSSFKNILFSIFYDSILEHKAFSNYIDNSNKVKDEEQKSRDKAFIKETIRKIIVGEAGIYELTSLIKKLTFYGITLIDIIDDIYKSYLSESGKYGFNDFNEFDFLTFSITKRLINSFNSVFFDTLRSNNFSVQLFNELKDIVVNLKNKKYGIETGNLSLLLQETEAFIRKYFEDSLVSKFNYSEYKGYDRLKNLIIKNAAISFYNFALNFENININTTREEFNKIVNDASNTIKYNYYTSYIIKSVKSGIDDVFSNFFESNYQSNKITNEAVVDYTGGNFENTEWIKENDDEFGSDLNDHDDNFKEISSLREIGVTNEIIAKLILNVYKNEYGSNIKVFTFDIFNAMCMHIKNKVDSELPLLILKKTDTGEYRTLNDEDVHDGVFRIGRREELATPEVQVVNVYSIKDLTLFFYFSTDELSSTDIMKTLNTGLRDYGVRKMVFARIIRKIKESEFIANMNVEFLNDTIRVLLTPGLNENHLLSILTSKKVGEQLPSFDLYTDSGYKTEPDEVGVIPYKKGSGAVTRCYITPFNFKYAGDRLIELIKDQTPLGIKTFQPFDWVIKLYNFAKFAKINDKKGKASNKEDKKSYYFHVKKDNNTEIYDDYFVKLGQEMNKLYFSKEGKRITPDPQQVRDKFYEWYFSVISDLFNFAESFIKEVTDPNALSDKNTVINKLIDNEFFKFAILTFNDAISFKSLNDVDAVRSKLLMVLYNKGGIGINDLFEYAFMLANSLNSLKKSLDRYSDGQGELTYKKLYDFMLNEVVIGGTYNYKEKKITEKDISDFKSEESKVYEKANTAASFSNLLRSVIFSNSVDFANKKISEMTSIVYSTNMNGERNGYPNNSLNTRISNVIKELNEMINGERNVGLQYNNYTTQLVEKLNDSGYRFLHVRYIRDGKMLMVTGDTFSRWRTNMISFMYDRTTLGLQNSVKKTLFNVYFSRNKVSYISEGRTPIEDVQTSKSLTSAIYDDFIEKLIDYLVSEITNKNEALDGNVLKKIIRASFKNKNILNDYYNEFGANYNNTFRSGIDDPAINYILTKIVNPLYNFNNSINEYGSSKNEIAKNIARLFLGAEDNDAVDKAQEYINAIKGYLDTLRGKNISDIIPVFSYMYYISVLAYNEYQSIRKYLLMNKKKITLKHYDGLYKGVVEFTTNEDGTGIKDISNIKDLPILNYYVQNLINKLSIHDYEENVNKVNESYKKIKDKVIDVIEAFINRDEELRFDDFYKVLNEFFVKEKEHPDRTKTSDNLSDFSTLYEYIKKGSFKELSIDVMLDNLSDKIQKMSKDDDYSFFKIKYIVDRYAEFASIFMFNYPLTTNFYDKDIFTDGKIDENKYIDNTSTVKNYFGYSFNPLLKVNANAEIFIFNRIKDGKVEFLRIGNMNPDGSIYINNIKYEDLIKIINNNIKHLRKLLPELSFLSNNVFSELTFISQISAMGDFVDYFRTGDEFIKRILSTTSSGNSVNYNINLISPYVLPFTHWFLRNSVHDGKTSVLEIEDPEVDLTGTPLFTYIRDTILKGENEELLNTIKEKFFKSNPTDGFCYSNIHFHYFTMIGLGIQNGILNKFMEFVNKYDGVIDNPEAIKSVKKEFFEWAKDTLLIEKVNIITGLKMQYAGIKEFEGMIFTSNHKYSWFPIHPLLVADNPDSENEFEVFARELHKYMLDNRINYITSAEKINKTRKNNKKHDLIVVSGNSLALNKDENGKIKLYPKVTINLNDLKLNTKNSQTKEVVPVNPKFFNIVYAVYQVYGNEGLEKVFDTFFDQSRNLTMEMRHKFINNVLEYIKNATGEKVPKKLDLQKALMIIKKLGKEVRLTPGNAFLIVPGVNQDTPWVLENEKIEIKVNKYTEMVSNDNIVASTLKSLKQEELKNKKLVILLSKTDIDKLKIDKNGYATAEKITLNLDGSLVYINNKSKNKIKILGTEVDYNPDDKNTIYAFDVNEMDELPNGNHGVLYRKKYNANNINVNKNRYSYKDNNGQDRSYFMFVEVDLSSMVQRGISQELFGEISEKPKVSKNISIIESQISKENKVESLELTGLDKSIDFFRNEKSKNKIEDVVSEVMDFLYTIDGQIMVGDIKFKSSEGVTLKVGDFINFYLNNRPFKLFKTDDVETVKTYDIFNFDKTIEYQNSTKVLDGILDINFIFKGIKGVDINHNSIVDYLKSKDGVKIEKEFERLFSLEKIKEFVKKYKITEDRKVDEFSQLIYHYLKLKFDIISNDTTEFIDRYISDKKRIYIKNENGENVDVSNEPNYKNKVIDFILNTEYSKETINFARAYNVLQLLGFKYISFEGLKNLNSNKENFGNKIKSYKEIIDNVSKINSLVILYNMFSSYITLRKLSPEYKDFTESVHLLPKYNIVSGLRDYTFKEMREIVGYNRYDISWHPNFAFLLFLKNDRGEIIGDVVELNKMLNNEGWVARNRKYLEAVGLRVPLQSDSSVSMFIPRRFNFSQNAVFVNSLLLLLQGADCDFDKLFVYTKLVKVVMIDENGKEKELYTFNNVMNKRMLLRALITAKKISSEKSNKRIEVRLEDSPSFEYHGGNIINVNSSIEAISELHRKGVKSLFNLLPLLDIFIIPTIKELYSDEFKTEQNTDIGTSAFGILNNTPSQQQVGRTIGMLVYFQSLLSPGFVTISGKEDLLDRVGTNGKELLNKNGLLHLFTYASYTTMVEFITLSVDVIKDLSGSHIYPLMTNPLLPVFFTYVNYNYLKLKDVVKGKTVLHYNKFVVRNTFFRFMIINELFKKYINVYRVDTSKPALDQVLNGLIDTIEDNMSKIVADFKLNVNHKENLENKDKKDLDSSLKEVSGEYIHDDKIDKSRILKLLDDVLFYNKDKTDKTHALEIYKKMLNVYYSLSAIKKLNDNLFKEQFEKMTFKPVGMIDLGNYNDPNFINFMNATMLPIIERLIKIRKDLEGNPNNLKRLTRFTEMIYNIFDDTRKVNTIIHALSMPLYETISDEPSLHTATAMKLVRDLGEKFNKLYTGKHNDASKSFNMTKKDITTLDPSWDKLNIKKFLDYVNKKMSLYELRDTKTFHTTYESFIKNMIGIYKITMLGNEMDLNKLKRLEKGDIDFELFREITYDFYEKLRNYNNTLKSLGEDKSLKSILNYFADNYKEHVENYSREKFLYSVIHKEITFKIHKNSSKFVDKTTLSVRSTKESLFLIKLDFKDFKNKTKNEKGEVIEITNDDFDKLIEKHVHDFFNHAFSFLKRVNLLYEGKVTVDKDNNFAKDSEKVVMTTYKIYRDIGIIPKFDNTSNNINEIESYKLFAKNYEQMISDLWSYYISAFNLKYNFIKNVLKEEDSKKDKLLATLKSGYLAAVSNALITFGSLIKDVIVSNPLLQDNTHEVNFGASYFEYIYKTINESIQDIVTFKIMEGEDMVTASKQFDILEKVIEESVNKSRETIKKYEVPDSEVSYSASDNNETKNIKNFKCK